jgi:hypothetical protein
VVFKEINKSIPTDTRGIWQKEIDAFAANRSALNPYLLTNKGTSSGEQRKWMRLTNHLM